MTAARPTPPPTTGSEVLLSACLIVRDEEERLPECLRSLSQVVDEVVAYDTGSRDRTRSLARAGGARVIRGYWNDDFGRARNSALAHCTGTWVLHIDADEVLECDPRALRAALASAQRTDGFTVPIVNLTGDGTEQGPVHRAVRLFLRDRCHWAGRLHEQVVRRGSPEVLRLGALEGVQLIHSGYIDEVMVGRNKHERNIRLAESDRAQAVPGVAEFNLARSLSAAGRHDEAAAVYEKALAFEDGTATSRRMILVHGFENLVNLGRFDAALEWAEQLRTASALPAIADFCAAKAMRSLGRLDDALALLDSLSLPIANEDGFELSPVRVLEERAAARSAAGRHTDAAEDLLALVEQSSDPGAVAGAAATLERVGLPLECLADSIPEGKLVRAAAGLTLLPPDLADRLAQRLLSRFGPRPEIVAASVRFAAGLALARCLEWAVLIRRAALVDHCPLLQRCRDERLDPRARLLSAAVAEAAFADERGRVALGGLLDGIDPAARAEVLAEITALAPALADHLTASEEPELRRSAQVATA